MPGGDVVVVDHAQIAEAHPLGIVVIGEGERVIRVQPAVVGVAPFVCFSNRHHIAPRCPCL